MIKGRDIVIVGQQAWDIEIGSNCKNIALEFSKYNRVLYVNPPLDRITKIRNNSDPKVQKRIRIIKGEEEGLIEVKENLWILYPDVLIESINWVRIHYLFCLLNKNNNRLIAKVISSAIIMKGFKSFILFNDSDIFRSFYLKEFLNPDLSIYYSRDNMIATKYWKRHGAVLEPKLIQKSDLCVANSEYLKNYCMKYNINSYYVGQGCDLELFKKDTSFCIPDRLRKIQFPIIGYLGALTSLRLDIDLIESLAKYCPYWNIVLVGPQDDVFEKSVLHNFENIYFIEACNPEDIPKYISAFDVCINPQILNELTIGNYPRKIDEYLAMGKPVVATKTETMLSFKDYVFLASNQYEFIDMIKEALKHKDIKSIKERREFAFSHSWENSVKAISQSIVSYRSGIDREL